MSKVIEHVGMFIAPERIEAGIRYRRVKRDDFIIKIMSNVVASLSGDQANFISNKDESEEFTASAETYVGGFIRTGKTQGLIDYTQDANTRTAYPFLELTHLDTLQKNYEYIVSELQGWVE
jgi:hypothetical protein